MEFLVKLALFIAAIVFFYKGAKFKTKPEKINQELINPQCDWVQKMEDAQYQKQRVCRMNPQFQNLEFLYALHNRFENCTVLTNKGILYANTGDFVPYQNIKGYHIRNGVTTGTNSDGSTATRENNRIKRFEYDYVLDNGQSGTAFISLNAEDINIFIDMFMTIMQQVQN